MTTINETPYSLTDIMRSCVFITSKATLLDTLTLMIEHKRNSLVVVDEAGDLVGMVNAADIIKAVLPEYIEENVTAARFSNMDLLAEDAARVKDMPVSDFMETTTPTISHAGNIIEAAAIAAHTGTGRIIVVDDAHKPIGVLTRTELKQVIGATLGICGDRLVSSTPHDK